MTRLLFVDDEPMVLQGLRRMLRSKRREWDMHFNESAKAALGVLASERFDLVVSDMRMPEMSGATLLAHVRRDSPGTARFILSGFTEEEGILQAAGPAHQFMAKPCDPDTLQTAIGQTIGFRRQFGSDAILEAVVGLESLPALPQSLARLSAALGDDEPSSERVAAILSSDVALAAACLKLTNSSFFAVDSAVATASEVVQVLGTGTLAALTEDAGVFRACPADSPVLGLIEALGQRSGRCARLAFAIAEELGLPSRAAGRVWCAALFAEVGRLALMDLRPVLYGSLDPRSGLDDLLGFEADGLETDQAEVGAALLGLWGFAPEVAELVRHLDRPESEAFQKADGGAIIWIARQLLSPVAPSVAADFGGGASVTRTLAGLGGAEAPARLRALADALDTDPAP